MYSTKVSLTDPQITVLRAEAERLGISVADVIRRALDEWRGKKEMRRKAETDWTEMQQISEAQRGIASTGS